VNHKIGKAPVSLQPPFTGIDAGVLQHIGDDAEMVDGAVAAPVLELPGEAQIEPVKARLAGGEGRAALGTGVQLVPYPDS
jgi:hypothetical protein